MSINIHALRIYDCVGASSTENAVVYGFCVHISFYVISFARVYKYMRISRLNL